MSSIDNQWQALMKSAQGGDAESYQDLLSDIYSHVISICRSKLAYSGGYEDCAQEVLMSVHKARHTYDPSKPFKPWLNAIIRFRVIDHLRKHIKLNKMEISSSDSLDQVHGEQSSENRDQELSEDVQKALSALPDKYREVVTLLKLKDLSVREAAQALNISESAVKVRASRGYNKLKTILEKNIRDTCQ